MKSDLDALMQARNLDALLVFGDAEHNPPMYYFVGGGHVSVAEQVLAKHLAAFELSRRLGRAEHAQAGRPMLKVLFMTGYAEKVASGNGFWSATTDLVTKPFEVDAFAVKVREILER